MAVCEVPLKPFPQRFALSLAGLTLTLSLTFLDVVNGGWIMDIADENGTVIVTGIPLVTGADLLAQYAYLGIPGKWYVLTDGAPYLAPTFANLGLTSHLYIETVDG